MVKIKFLDSPCDKRKCGDYVLGSALGGLFGFVNTQDTNAANADINARALQFQAEQNQIQRDWQREENLTAFNREQRSLSDAAARNDMYWQKQFDVQSGEWYKQQDYALTQWMQQQEYNSPYNQVQRARSAGYNPSAVGADGGGLQDTSVTLPHTSVPSPSVTPAQTGSGFAGGPSLIGAPSQIPMQSFGFGQLMSGLGSFIHDISSSDIAQSQKDVLLRKLEFEAEGQDINNRMNQIELSVLSDTKAPRTKKAFADLRQTLGMARLLDAQEDTEIQKAISEQVDQLLKFSQKELNDQKAAELRVIVPYLPKLYTAQIEREKSAASANYASADASRASAENLRALTTTENLIRTPKVWAQQVVNSIGRGTMRLQDLQEMILKVKLDNEQARNVVLELQRQRSESLLDDRNDSWQIRQLDDLIYFFSNHFHIGASFNANYGDFNK